MGLRQRAKDAWDRHQEEILKGKIRTTRKLLREKFGVKEEEMDTFETASIGLNGADKTIRVEDLLFMVDDAGALYVRDQRVTQPQENPWKPIDSLEDLGQITAQTNFPQLPRI